MLTIFSTCRSFLDKRFNLIQRNAIKSWTLLKPQPQIIIIGNDPGSREICEEFDLKFIENVQCSNFGTPLFNSMISLAEKFGKFDTKLYASSDIILFQNTITAVKSLKTTKEFCGVVVKLENKKINNLIDFGSDWTSEVLTGAERGMITSGDYYMYSKGFWNNSNMPDFAIGRTYVDSWMFCEAMKRKKMVNMSACVKIVHQHHHYNHIPQGDPERQVNRSLKQGFGADIRHANWIMDHKFRIKENTGRVKSKHD